MDRCRQEGDRWEPGDVRLSVGEPFHRARGMEPPWFLNVNREERGKQRVWEGASVMKTESREEETDEVCLSILQTEIRCI